jgi:hypothetical protein
VTFIAGLRASFAALRESALARLRGARQGFEWRLIGAKLPLALVLAFPSTSYSRQRSNPHDQQGASKSPGSLDLRFL